MDVLARILSNCADVSYPQVAKWSPMYHTKLRMMSLTQADFVAHQSSPTKEEHFCSHSQCYSRGWEDFLITQP